MKDDAKILEFVLQQVKQILEKVLQEERKIYNVILNGQMVFRVLLFFKEYYKYI